MKIRYELEVGDKVIVTDLFRCEEDEKEFEKLVGCVGTVVLISSGCVPWNPWDREVIYLDGKPQITGKYPYFVSFDSELMEKLELQTEYTMTDILGDDAKMLFGFWFQPGEIEFTNKGV